MSNIADNHFYHIGQQVHLARWRPKDVTEKIKALGEVCAQKPTPHLHIITNLGVYCRRLDPRA